MKDTEAVSLYYAILEGTPTQATEMGADLWCEATRHLRYEDARESVVALLKRQTFISAAELCEEVKRIRNDRLQRHGPIVPPPGLSVIDEVAWMRDAIREVADGGVRPDPRGELKSRDVASLGTIGKRVQ